MASDARLAALRWVETNFIRLGVWQQLPYLGVTLGVQVWLAVPMPNTLVDMAIMLAWCVVGIAVAYVFARRILYAPLVYAELQDSVDACRSRCSFRAQLSAWASYQRLTFRYWYVSHKRDAVAVLAILFGIVSLVGRSGTLVVCSALAFLGGINGAWYLLKARYLTPALQEGSA